MSVPNPEHLLDQAVLLANPSGPGVSRQADMRRAISAAYYAVFHAVITAASDTWVGKTKRGTREYALAYRSVDHRTLRKLCEEVEKSTASKKYQPFFPTDGFGPDMRVLAETLIALQEKRHTADYDPLFEARRSDALIAITLARTALHHFRTVNSAERRAFLSLIVFPPR